MRYILFIPLLIALNIYGQVNLVPNGSFENYKNCPSYPTTTQVNYYLANWFSAVYSPDYFHECSDTVWGVPLNAAGYSHAISGVGYTGLLLWDKSFFYREMLGAKLKHSLNSGSKYNFSCWVQAADSTGYAVKNFGAFFKVDSLPIQGQNEQLQYLVNKTPQVAYLDTVFIQDTQNWIKVMGEFIANGGENFLFLGNFDTDLETDTLFLGGSQQFNNHAYVYIDSITLYEDTTTSLQEHVPPQSIGINYMQGQLIVEKPAQISSGMHLEVYDISGKLITAYELPANNHHSIPLSFLSSGLYIYSISSPGLFKSGKFVVQN